MTSISFNVAESRKKHVMRTGSRDNLKKDKRLSWSRTATSQERRDGLAHTAPSYTHDHMSRDGTLYEDKVCEFFISIQGASTVKA